MPGDRTQSQRQPRSAGSPPETSADSPAVQEWYVVTGSGASALRISSGLTVGETEAGALALNDPQARHQWIEFVLGESGDPWVAIVTRDKSLRVDGVTHMRHQVTVGAAVELPGNTLYISHDIRMPRPAGVVIEVVPRDVPTGPRDLVGPGWEHALAAVQEPAPAAAAGLAREALEPEAPIPPGSAAAARVPEPDEDPDRTEVLEPRDRPRVRARAADPPSGFADPLDDIGVSVAEPRPARPYRRRPQRGRQASVLIGSIAVVAVALGGVAAVLYSLSLPDRPGLTDLAVPLSGEPADTSPEPAATLPSERAPGADGPAADPGRNPSLAEPGIAGAGQEPAAPAETMPGEPSSVSGPEPGTSVARPEDPGSTVAGSAPLPAEQRQPAAQPEPDVGSPDRSPTGSLADSTTGRAAGQSGDAALLPSADQRTERAAQSSGSSTPVEESVPVAADRPARERVTEPVGPPDWRLVRARELLEAGYITYPPEDNAVAYLERLLLVDPGNPQALAMLDECTARLIEAAVRAHDQGMDYEARNTLEEVLGFDPENASANTLWREWVGTRP